MRCPNSGAAFSKCSRQPIEEGRIAIARARYAIEYPAAFMLVGSMNPCPCGYYAHPDKHCGCHPSQVRRYLQRTSGPLLDRFDLHVQVQPVPLNELTRASRGEPSRTIRERVVRAREVQAGRFRDTGPRPGAPAVNARMTSEEVRKWCELEPGPQAVLETAMNRLGLSVRAYMRVLKVARTAADQAGEERIRPEDIAEAVGYRSLDRHG